MHKLLTCLTVGDQLHAQQVVLVLLNVTVIVKCNKFAHYLFNM